MKRKVLKFKYGLLDSPSIGSYDLSCSGPNDLTRVEPFIDFDTVNVIPGLSVALNAWKVQDNDDKNYTFKTIPNKSFSVKSVLTGMASFFYVDGSIYKRVMDNEYELIGKGRMNYNNEAKCVELHFT